MDTASPKRVFLEGGRRRERRWKSSGDRTIEANPIKDHLK